MSGRRPRRAVPLGVAVVGVLAPLGVAAQPAPRVGVVDRIEGEFAVVEWSVGELEDVPLSALPPGVAEGDPVLRPRPPRRAAAPSWRWRRRPRPRPEPDDGSP